MELKIADLDEIGRRLQERRKERNLSSKPIADIVGVTEGTYGRWEAAKVEGGGRLLAMAAAHFGMTPNDLFLQNVLYQGEEYRGLAPEEQRDLQRILKTAMAIHSASGGQVFPLSIMRKHLDEIAEHLQLTIPAGTEISAPEPGVRTYEPRITKGKSQAKGTAEGEAKYGKTKRGRR